MAPMRVSINILARNAHATRTCQAMAEGIKRCGDIPVYRTDSDHNMDGFSAAVLWGYVTSCQTVIKSCIDRGIPWVFLDMGYWKREANYFKVSVNDRHPTAYFQKHSKDHRRWSQLGIPLMPRQRNESGYILIAGMSGKAAWSWNLPAEQFERELISTIVKMTDRQIVYRPKPNWAEATKLKGARFDVKTPVHKALGESWCVATHHSNVGCDALVAGVPIFSKRGIASVLSNSSLLTVTAPVFPTDAERQQWAHDAAYCQWSVDEMAQGYCWSWLKEEGLI